MNQKHILIPSDLLESLIENTDELIGEWAWKRRTPSEVELTRMEREAAQARALMVDELPIIVWKAFRGDESCHFGSEGQAAVFAGKRGTVERIELTPPALEVVK
ncbi:hypothetical protein [Thiothrix fructosivorans]|uniref:Uncharacterized protein n=1 Tax=Thiothrix fructosivorans TaxID=111770 RepID=A0A8B0SP14_9GAMM|nr:hypothetical protein [Thiothrix fructosivorans]MBO0611698.1 hypothetical protein [Thiothrix fructosivorans]QTX10642.1 hypothetical protein J1836_019090 [Thiothrix fructosivorans]